MQTQVKDEVYQQAVRNIANRWPEMGPAERANRLARFPELAAMGLKVTDPFDAAVVARDEETAAQCRMLDEGPSQEQP